MYNSGVLNNHLNEYTEKVKEYKNRIENLNIINKWMSQYSNQAYDVRCLSDFDGIDYILMQQVKNPTECYTGYYYVLIHSNGIVTSRMMTQFDTVYNFFINEKEDKVPYMISEDEFNNHLKSIVGKYGIYKDNYEGTDNYILFNDVRIDRADENCEVTAVVKYDAVIICFNKGVIIDKCINTPLHYINNEFNEITKQDFDINFNTAIQLITG